MKSKHLQILMSVRLIIIVIISATIYPKVSSVPVAPDIYWLQTA